MLPTCTSWDMLVATSSFVVLLCAVCGWRVGMRGGCCLLWPHCVHWRKKGLLGPLPRGLLKGSLVVRIWSPASTAILTLWVAWSSVRMVLSASHGFCVFHCARCCSLFFFHILHPYPPTRPRTGICDRGVRLAKMWISRCHVGFYELFPETIQLKVSVGE